MSFRKTGDATFYGEFRVKATGTLTDPTTLTLKIRTPSAVITSYTYGAGEITKDSTGKFHKVVSLDEAGKWAYSWIATGSVAATEEGDVEVLGSDYGL